MFDLGYSLSDVVREEYLNWFFLRNGTAAGLALLLAVLVTPVVSGGLPAQPPSHRYSPTI